LKYGTLPELQKQFATEEQLYDDSKKSKTESMVSDTVTDDAIAEIVAKWTGIPVSKLLEGDMQKLLRLQSELDKRVVGQSEATRVVAEAIQRSRAGELYGQSQSSSACRLRTFSVYLLTGAILTTAVSSLKVISIV
jgi:ATP-dependent Clp protease ATP-binding subunit ClpB